MQPSSSALLLLLALAAAAAGAEGLRAQLGSPVEKVVHLLRDLKDRIEQDGENEEQAYNKYSCFCDKALKGKADSIDAAAAGLRKTGQEILKLRGRVATRSAEVTELEQAITTNEDLQADKTAIRQKENGRYASETAEMKQALSALEQAILVLKNATATAFLQTTSASASEARLRRVAATRRVLQVLPASSTFDPDQLSLLSSFAKADDSYAPQSLTVNGILQNMYDTFSADLESSVASEAKANAQFEQFIATKAKQSQAMETVKLGKEDDKAKAEQLLAEATSLYDKTEAQRKADIAYFDATKASCELKSYEWGNRSQLRSEELQGVRDALALLGTDAARELFDKAIKPGKEVGADASYSTGVSLTSFVQLGSEESAARAASRAYALLKAHAAGVHSLRLAQLAASLREAKVGHFDQVIAAINAMITTLQDEDNADIAKRDQCKAEYAKINSTVADLSWKIKNNKAAINSLDRLIQDLEAEKAQTLGDIQQVDDDMLAMTSQRTMENQDFLQHKKEDQDAIKLLDTAKVVLSAYYQNNSIAFGPIQGSIKGLALVQEHQPAPEFAISKYDAPDATFSDKGSRKHETKGVVSIMTMLIEDLSDEIRNSMKDEAEAQLQYNASMVAAQTLKADLVAKKLSLDDSIAKRTTEKAQEDKKMSMNEAERKDEVNYRASIAPDCDWIIGAFEKRAKRRAEELDGLVGAKDYLAGASEASLLQRSSRSASETSDDSALSEVRFLGISA